MQIAEMSSNESSDISPSAVIETETELKVGAIVVADYQRHGNWYRGIIEKDWEDGTYDIAYDDGDREEKVAKSCIKLSTPAVGDHFQPENTIDIPVGSKFRLLKRHIDSDDQDVYLGENISTGEKVAIKVEPLRCENGFLLCEGKALRLMNGVVGIPSARWYGIEGNYNVLVCDLLGKSLEDLFNDCGGRFNLKTTLLVADQLLRRVEIFHANNLLHRNLSPLSFYIGRGSHSRIVYIDNFWVSKLYRDPHTNRHIPYREGKALIGKARYASINTHKGIEQSRRDDLESLGYVLMYFLRGSLPWQGLPPAETKEETYQNILNKKIATPVDVLCRGFPSEFKSYFEHVFSLNFEDRPDYDYLKRLFRELFFRKKGFADDGKFDWDRLSCVDDKDENFENPDEAAASAATAEGNAEAIISPGSSKSKLDSEAETVKVVFAGFREVGKKSILSALNGGDNDDDASEIYHCEATVPIKDKTLKLQLSSWESSLSGRAEEQDEVFKNADCLILVFDITSSESFAALDQFLLDFRQFSGRDKEPESFPILLVGNKSDLSDQRAVHTEDIVDWCLRTRPRGHKNPISFIECSAIRNVGVGEIFPVIAEKFDLSLRGDDDDGYLSLAEDRDTMSDGNGKEETAEVLADEGQIAATVTGSAVLAQRAVDTTGGFWLLLLLSAVTAAVVGAVFNIYFTPSSGN